MLSKKMGSGQSMGTLLIHVLRFVFLALTCIQETSRHSRSGIPAFPIQHTQPLLHGSYGNGACQRGNTTSYSRRRGHRGHDDQREDAQPDGVS